MSRLAASSPMISVKPAPVQHRPYLRAELCCLTGSECLSQDHKPAMPRARENITNHRMRVNRRFFLALLLLSFSLSCSDLLRPFSIFAGERCGRFAPAARACMSVLQLKVMFDCWQELANRQTCCDPMYISTGYILFRSF